MEQERRNKNILRNKEGRKTNGENRKRQTEEVKMN